MPFLVYEESGESLRQTRTVSLGGKHGPFAQHVEALLDNGAEAPIKWHLTGSEMLDYLDVDDPEGHALVVDLKPSIDHNVSLYEITHVWGHTKPTWTPLALRMKTIFVDREEPDPDLFMEQFQLPSEGREQVHEFLYLTGGAESDSWGWGRTGTVNAVLLWPSTFRYFVEAMTEDLDWKP